MHFWQPTNAVVQRNNRMSVEKRQCTEYEQVDGQMHYMMCPSPYFVVEARKFAWNQFKVKMKKDKRETTLFQVMWLGIQNWINGEELDELPWGNELNKTQHESLKVAYAKQGEIGWKHFLVGRVSIHWSKYYSLRIKDDEESNGKVIAFGRDLVYNIWFYTLSVWQSHNMAVHGKNNKYSTRNVKCIQEFVKKIYREYRHFILEEDEWLFRESERIRLDQSIPQIIGWLERVLLCLEEIKDAENLVVHAKRVLDKMCISSVFI